MRLGTALVLSAVSCCFAGEARAADPPPLKVLRHLTFDVSVDVRTRSETKVAGFEGPVSGTAVDATNDDLRSGTISVDVVGATGDGGLVVDVSEDVTARRAAAVRVGITDKALFYGTRGVVTEEERALLHFLARDFVSATDISSGTSWTEDMGSGGTSDRTTYRVTAVDADAKTIGIDVAGATSMPGPNGFQSRTHGSLTYDTGVLVPVNIDLHTETKVLKIGQLTTVDTIVTSHLRDDSFRRRPPA